jgi:outer membrane protein OmpA-like peptidoglycan-associated protein
MLPRPLISTLLLSLATGLAAAGDVKVYRANEIVDPMEVVRILEGSSPRALGGARAGAATQADDQHAIRTRSIRLFDDPAAPPLAAKTRPAARAESPPPARTEVSRPSAAASEVHAAAAGDITRVDPQKPGGASVLSLPIQFAFDSAEILPSARAQLDALAEGVRLLPDTTRVVIEGHTDAAGSDSYNQELSLRRAQSVKRYLVAAHGIEGSRLRAMGLGEYAPLVGLAPHAPENRRVQFRGER